MKALSAWAIATAAGATVRAENRGHVLPQLPRAARAALVARGGSTEPVAPSPLAPNPSEEAMPERCSVAAAKAVEQCTPPPRPGTALAEAAQDLFFSEHGRCGAARRKSQRCREGYGAAILTNSLAGVTCALAMMPEAIGFSFVAGVDPITALWTTVAMGATASLCGGRGGVITGASGAVAMVTGALVRRHGAGVLPPCVAVAGALQLAAGRLQLGRWIRLVPQPVLLGFVNGLAVAMTRAQLSHFRDPASGALLKGGPLFAACGIAGATVALIKALPRLLGPRCPTSLLAVILATLAAKAMRLPHTTLADLAGADTFKGGLAALPRLRVPGLSLLRSGPPGGAPPPYTPLELLRVVLPTAATVCVAGLIESLLTLELVDGLVDDGTRGSSSAECRGQGLANLAAAAVGGMGGCAMIGQTLVNLDSGGAAPLSGVAMSLALAAGIVGCAPLLGAVPVAALAGLMLLVCHSTFAWSTFRLMGTMPRTDALVLAVTSVVVVARDLAAAVVAGTVLSALAFAWTMSTQVSAERTRFPGPGGEERFFGHVTDGGPRGYYKVAGNVFFGSARHFRALFDTEFAAPPPSSAPAPSAVPPPSWSLPAVVLDFADAKVLDHSATAAVAQLCAKLGAGRGPGAVALRHLSPDAAAAVAAELAALGFAGATVETDPHADPQYDTAAVLG